MAGDEANPRQYPLPREKSGSEGEHWWKGSWAQHGEGKPGRGPLLAPASRSLAPALGPLEGRRVVLDVHEDWGPRCPSESPGPADTDRYRLQEEGLVHMPTPAWAGQPLRWFPYLEGVSLPGEDLTLQEVDGLMVWTMQLDPADPGGSALWFGGSWGYCQCPSALFKCTWHLGEN